jgi:hypothetical protein
MLGPNWPNNGEIDIIEGVNEQTQNQVALHTSNGCTINNSGFTGNLKTPNCYDQAPGQSANSGCVIQDGSTQSYGLRHISLVLPILRRAGRYLIWKP